MKPIIVKSWLIDNFVGMAFLIISILSSTLLGFIFKFYPKYGVDTFQAIVFNYLVCVLCGWVAIGSFPMPIEILETEWFPFACACGFLFISGFNIGALTMQKFGVTIGTVMMKMSILISATFPILFYGESSNWFKLLGIFISIIAILLVNKPNKDLKEGLIVQQKWLYILPFGTWLISGIIEILLFHVERISGTGVRLSFVSTLFGIAFLGGFIIMSISLITGKMKWSLKNLVAGIILGVPNFFSIYFLYKILGLGWEASVIFPVNNISIIGLAAIVAYLVFGERLSKYNTIGVVLSGIAILLFALSKEFTS